MQSKQYEIYTGSQTAVLLIDLVEVTGATSFCAYNHGIVNLRQTKKMYYTIKWNFLPKMSPHPLPSPSPPSSAG